MEQQFIHTVNKYQAIIHKVCRLYRDTPEDREDLFQEIVYQLWKAYPSFQKQSLVSTWMYRIALSTAMAKYRKKSSSTPTTSLENIEITASSPGEAHPKQEILYRAIATLSAPERAIIALYLDDYSYEEIADMIGISANYVGVKLNRIKQKLIHLLLFVGTFAFLLLRVPMTDQKLLIVLLVLPASISIRTWFEVRQWYRNITVVRDSLAELTGE